MAILEEVQNSIGGKPWLIAGVAGIGMLAYLYFKGKSASIPTSDVAARITPTPENSTLFNAGTQPDPQPTDQTLLALIGQLLSFGLSPDTSASSDAQMQLQLQQAQAATALQLQQAQSASESALAQLQASNALNLQNSQQQFQIQQAQLENQLANAKQQNDYQLSLLQLEAQYPQLIQGPSNPAATTPLLSGLRVPDTTQVPNIRKPPSPGPGYKWTGAQYLYLPKPSGNYYWDYTNERWIPTGNPTGSTVPTTMPVPVHFYTPNYSSGYLVPNLGAFLR